MAIQALEKVEEMEEDADMTPRLSFPNDEIKPAEHDLSRLADMDRLGFQPRPGGSSVSSASKHNLHLEMSNLANSAAIHTSVSYSYRQRSLRSLSIAEKLAGSMHLQPQDLGLTTSVESHELVLDELQEELKEKAVVVIRRVKDKLTGLDFNNDHQSQHNTRGHGNLSPLDVHEQVDKLIQRATSNELLCQGFFGWCPFW